MHPDEPIPPPDAADASATPTPARPSGVDCISPPSRVNRMVEKSQVPPPKSPTSTVASSFSSRAKKKAAPTGSYE